MTYVVTTATITGAVKTELVAKQVAAGANGAENPWYVFLLIGVGALSVGAAGGFIGRGYIGYQG